MIQSTRRDWIQRSLATLAAAGLAPGAQAGRNRASKPGGIKLALALGPGQHERFALARQIGVNHAIATVLPALSKVTRNNYVETLAKIKADFKAAGLTIEGVESHPVPAEKIKLGLPGRDEEIENYRAAIEALGKVGIPVLCYNFMAGLGWYRTKVDVPERGGALTSEFDNRVAKKQRLTEWGEISEQKIWDNIEYFLKAVIPVAEKAGVIIAGC
jgi:mannonate dehydratase